MVLDRYYISNAVKLYCGQTVCVQRSSFTPRQLWVCLLSTSGNLSRLIFVFASHISTWQGDGVYRQIRRGRKREREHMSDPSTVNIYM